MPNSTEALWGFTLRKVVSIALARCHTDFCVIMRSEKALNPVQTELSCFSASQHYTTSCIASSFFSVIYFCSVVHDNTFCKSFDILVNLPLDCSVTFDCLRVMICKEEETICETTNSYIRRRCITPTFAF